LAGAVFQLLLLLLLLLIFPLPLATCPLSVVRSLFVVAWHHLRFIWRKKYCGSCVVVVAVAAVAVVGRRPFCPKYLCETLCVSVCVTRSALCLEIEAVAAANSIQMFLAQSSSSSSSSRKSNQTIWALASNLARQRQRVGGMADRGGRRKGRRGRCVSALDMPLVVAFFFILCALFRKCLKHKRRQLRLKDCQLVEWVEKLSRLKRAKDIEERH